MREYVCSSGEIKNVFSWLLILHVLPLILFCFLLAVTLHMTDFEWLRPLQQMTEEWSNNFQSIGLLICSMISIQMSIMFFHDFMAYYRRHNFPDDNSTFFLHNFASAILFGISAFIITWFQFFPHRGAIEAKCVAEFIFWCSWSIGLYCALCMTALHFGHYVLQIYAVWTNWKINPSQENMNLPHTKCAVCHDAAPNIAFSPCNHMCCCENCSNALGDVRCPICRAPIHDRTRIYY